jgi:D-sedoheptulose 7-phosphate isomerase
LRDKVIATLKESADTKLRSAEVLADDVAKVAEVIIASLRKGGTVAFCGNGGSAADAQHLAGELIGRFLRERPAFSAIALTTDSSILTAIGNDYGFDQVFSRQVEGLLRSGDVLIAISTSGTAQDVIKAVEMAKAKGVFTVAFTNSDGGPLAAQADLPLRVPSKVTARVQEVHITIGHAICDLVEEALAADSP